MKNFEPLGLEYVTSYQLPSLSCGSLYFLFSSIIYAPVFIKVVEESIAYVNIPIDNAILPNSINNKLLMNCYNKVVNTYHHSIEYFKDYEVSYIDRLILLCLNELVSVNTLVVGTAGISKDSLQTLVDFSAKFLKKSKDKIIIISQFDTLSKHYPDFLIVEADMDSVVRSMNLFNKSGTENATVNCKNPINARRKETVNTQDKFNTILCVINLKTSYFKLKKNIVHFCFTSVNEGDFVCVKEQFCYAEMSKKKFVVSKKLGKSIFAIVYHDHNNKRIVLLNAHKRMLKKIVD